jgi:hypothetical protein
VEWGQKAYPRIFTKQLIAQCRGHIDQARAIGNNAVVAARLEMVSTGFAYFESYLACREAAKGKMAYADYKKARDRCDTLVDQLHAVNKDFILAEVAKDYLEKELGIAASKCYAAEMGLINEWMLIGPFDNLHRQGHTTAYPPEQSLDFTKSHAGKDGKRLAWFPYHGQSWQGMLDLIAIIGPVDWGTTYAACRVTSPLEQAAQFRIGSNDSVKVWLNGKEVWDNLVGRSLMLDSDIVPVILPQGDSTILLKVSNIGGNWGFCFRVTDEDGNAIKGLKVALEHVETGPDRKTPAPEQTTE